MTKEEKSAIIAEFATKEGDVGSSEVQVALLTARIKHLTEHMKANKKDNGTRRGLVAMVNRRKSLLKYLDKKNHESYKALIAKLGLRK